MSASQFGMVGKSPAMQHLLSEIALVAPSEATVLIHGDSGTGKELVARAIHASSARSEKTAGNAQLRGAQRILAGV